MARVGYAGPMIFCKEVGISLPTYLRVVRTPEKARQANREAIAGALKFKEWADLEKAYAADNVSWGLTPLDIVRVEVPTPPGRPFIPETIEIVMTINARGQVSFEDKTDTPNSRLALEMLRSRLAKHGMSELTGRTASEDGHRPSTSATSSPPLDSNPRELPAPSRIKEPSARSRKKPKA